MTEQFELFPAAPALAPSPAAPTLVPSPVPALAPPPPIAARFEPAASLNQPQSEAVRHVDGPLIVFAGAGSGKTRVITYRIANLVMSEGVRPWTILAVTFTNKAAGEMRARLESLLGAERTKQLWIGTFHAVCIRFLRQHHAHAGLGKSFVIYDDADQKAVMKRVLKDLGLDEKRLVPQQVLARIHREKQEARGPDAFSVDGPLDGVILRCYKEYEQRLRAANAVDFEDILLHVLRLVEDEQSAEGRELCARFEHVLVDEFQDTNLVQYRLVRALSRARRNLCVVGDDDQSIYRWRGADIRNIRGFRSDYPDARLIKLEENYRSSANIVKAALGVIRPSRERQPKELFTLNAAGAEVLIVHTATERDEAATVVDGLRRKLDEGASPRELAVFYRVHAQSRVLEEALRGEGLPYQIVGGLRFFDRAEVKDLLAYLRLVENPASDVDLLRIINVPPRKIGDVTIERLIDVAGHERISAVTAIPKLCESGTVNAGARRALTAFAELFASLTAAKETAGPRELAERILDDSGYATWLRAQDSVEGDARLDNLREFLGSLDEYEEEALSGGMTPTLTDYLARITLASDTDTLSEVARIPMMTVHAAKGLEFEAVWMTGLEEGLFPLMREDQSEDDQVEEERRLAYVAITRAKVELTMTYAATRTIYGRMRYNAPSRFLFDLPTDTQRRTATEACLDLSRSYGSPSSERPFRASTFGERAPSRSAFGNGERPVARAPGRGAPSQTSPRAAPLGVARPAPRAVGERFVERDLDGVHDSDAGVVLGSRVRHKKFGPGVVVELGGGADPTVTVKFPGWGVKQIKLSFLTPG
ncbi:MAG: ATP-dependent DNA helicase [Myxococcales bacterium]|nr:ATP-dependent DNA helicase [Myxococcales bacterium]